MTQVHRIPVEKMTEKAFRPFGQLMLSKEKPPYEGVSYRLKYEAGKTQIGTNWLPYKGFRFTGLEQHLHVSQSFVHLQGAPAVLAVAAPTDPSKPDSIPKPEDVHVFLIEPHTGYLLKRGTWHSDRLPIYAAGLDDGDHHRRGDEPGPAGARGDDHAAGQARRVEVEPHRGLRARLRGGVRGGVLGAADASRRRAASRPPPRVRRSRRGAPGCRRPGACRRRPWLRCPP